MPEIRTLKEVRKRTINPQTGRPYTGREVAEAVGVDISAYFRWEYGKTSPNGVNLVRLEKVLPGATPTLISMEVLA